MTKLLSALGALFLCACAAGGVAPVESPAAAAGKPTTLSLDCGAPITEGQSATCAVSVKGGNGKAVRIAWSTDNGLSGSVSASTKVAGTFKVPTLEDTIVNGTRSIAVTAKSSTASAAATVTVLDNDVPPPPPATQTCADGSVIPASQMCPMPTPAQTGYIASPSLGGLAGIPTTDFDPATGVVPFGLPPAMTGDSVGAFRFTCGPGQILADDPIVYPGQPGRSHLHQFYGDMGANAYTTYESLRHSTANSSCNNSPGHVLNRSAYWMPAMLDGKGNVRRPEYVSIYYKRYPLNSAECKDPVITKGCLAVPNGLRFIFGRDMLNLSGPRTGNFHFSCAAANGGSVPGGDGPTGTGFPDMSGALAVCKPGMKLLASIGAPGCWDGKNLDTPDHRSHVGYPVFGIDPLGAACPAATPYVIPTFTLTAAYNILDGDDPTMWRLASDAMAPNEPAGSTFHADFFEAHDPIEKKTWTDNCIDGFLSGTMGNLCDGTGLPGAAWGNWPWDPQTVPLSQVPVTPTKP